MVPAEAEATLLSAALLEEAAELVEDVEDPQAANMEAAIAVPSTRLRTFFFMCLSSFDLHICAPEIHFR